MITLGGFIGGSVVMALGFMTVWKTAWLLRYLGDVGNLFGGSVGRWMSWKLIGLIAIALGFFIAFDLFDDIFGGLLLKYLFGDEV